MSAAFAAGILVMPLAPAAWKGAVTLLSFSLPLLWSLRGRRIFAFVFTAAFSLTGFLHAYKASLRPPAAIEQWIPPDAKQWTALSGTVKTFPEIKRNGNKKTLSFVLASQQLRFSPPGARPRYAEVNGDVQVFLHNGSVTPKPGERVSLFGQLEKPKTAQNPGGFDYSRYLAQSGIHALFHVYGSKSARILKNQKQSWAGKFIASIQSGIAGAIDALYSERG